MNARAFQLRERVFGFLDDMYGEEPLIQMRPFRVLDLIREYYNTIIRPLINQNLIACVPIPARNLNKGRPEFVKIYKSDDNIFWTEEKKDEKKEEREEILPDERAFPSLNVYREVDSAEDDDGM